MAQTPFPRWGRTSWSNRSYVKRAFNKYRTDRIWIGRGSQRPEGISPRRMPVACRVQCIRQAVKPCQTISNLETATEIEVQGKRLRSPKGVVDEDEDAGACQMSFWSDVIFFASCLYMI